MVVALAPSSRRVWTTEIGGAPREPHIGVDQVLASPKRPKPIAPSSQCQLKTPVARSALGLGFRLGRVVSSGPWEYYRDSDELDGPEISKTSGCGRRHSPRLLAFAFGTRAWPAALNTIVRYPEEICRRSRNPIVPTKFWGSYRSPNPRHIVSFRGCPIATILAVHKLISRQARLMKIYRNTLQLYRNQTAVQGETTQTLNTLVFLTYEFLDTKIFKYEEKILK